MIRDNSTIKHINDSQQKEETLFTGNPAILNSCFPPDTGAGMSEERRRGLFKAELYGGGGEPTVATFQSSGLGLKISKVLAVQMGGDLELNWSEKGKVVGLFLTETISAVFDEIRDAVKHGVGRTKGFWDDLKERLNRIVLQIISKWKEALKEGFAGMLSGIFSNIVTVIINTFMTTAKNIVRLIREGFFSIVKAVKMLMNPPAGMTKEQAFHEAGKIIIAALAVSIGILLEETIDKFPPMKLIRSIPVIGELLYSTVFGFMIGLVTSLALWGWDKLDLFGVKEGARHDFVLNMLIQDRQQIIEQHKQWLSRMKEREPERFLFLSEELRLVW
ncbi:hypothetical protein [Paenibacillus sp. sgz302251]|uniref:hypothetical protein n=1 Tax=Paenibacillus sp. sgz302251 TaxID=3414493 RepID=UPI003C7C097A